MNFGSGGNTDSKAWKDIWGSGQGWSYRRCSTVGDLVLRIRSEFNEATSDFNNKIKIS